MATAEARICNRALARIGQTQRIDNLTDNSVPARACKAIYEDSRDATLEARDWPFARRRATLGAITDGERGGWTYAYTLPADCIAPRFIDLGTGEESQSVPFELEDDALLGTILLTDQAPAELVYTARIEAPPRFSKTFIDALAYYLASDLAFSLAKKPVLGRDMVALYEKALSRAAGVAGRSRKPRARPKSTFERVR